MDAWHQIAQFVCNLQSSIARANECLRIDGIAVFDGVATVKTGCNFGKWADLVGNVQHWAVSQMFHLLVLVEPILGTL